MKIYLNGSIVDKGKAKVSIFDSGFLHGDGLFETMRAYSGAIFLLDRHLDRLISAAHVLEFGSMIVKAELERACMETLNANGLINARVRLTVTRGEEDESESTVIVVATPFDGYDKQLYENGMSAITLSGFRCSGNITSTIKSNSYLSSIMPRRKAMARGYDEAILVNERGNIAEGSFTNIFCLREGGLYTPPVSDGLLPGITRGFVIELAKQAGYEVIQRSIHASDLFKMEEVFLTNSMMEIMPLTKVNGSNIDDGRPGTITIKLAQLYKQSVLDWLAESKN